MPRVWPWAKAHAPLDTLPDSLRAETFPLCSPYNGHCTPSGHRVMARALARCLRETPLLAEDVGCGAGGLLMRGAP